MNNEKLKLALTKMHLSP